MAKAALLAALVALGLSGWLAWKTTCSTCGAHPPTESAPSSDVARLEAIERRLDGLENAPRPAAPSASSAGPTLGVAPRRGADADPAAASEGERSAATRLEDLEKRLATVEEARRKEAEAPGAALGALASRTGRFSRPGWVTSTEDAQKEMELTDGQKAEWDRIVADARREAEALRKIPDDEGKTWDQVQREMVADLVASQGGGAGARFDFTKVVNYRNKTIPGRRETYGQADQRIKDDAKRRMRDTLTTAQTEKFDKSNVDPILGGFPGIVTTAVAIPEK